MDDQAVVRAIERWRRTGDEHALSQALPWLERWLSAPASVVHVLGREEVAEVRDAVMEALLVGRQPLGPEVRQPHVFATTVFRNKLRDRLRRYARQPDVSNPGVARDLAAETHAQPGPAVESLLETERRLQRIQHVLRELRLEERTALLLLHAPDRISTEDWQVLVERHPPPPPLRPAEAISREVIAGLLYPGEPAPRGYERTGKLVQRAYKKLRHALAAHAERMEEDGQ